MLDDCRHAPYCASPPTSEQILGAPDSLIYHCEGSALCCQQTVDHKSAGYCQMCRVYWYHIYCIMSVLIEIMTKYWRHKTKQ